MVGPPITEFILYDKLTKKEVIPDPVFPSFSPHFGKFDFIFSKILNVENKYSKNIS